MLPSLCSSRQGPLCCKCLFIFFPSAACVNCSSQGLSCSPLHSWYLTQCLTSTDVFNTDWQVTHWRPRRDTYSLGVNNLNVGRQQPRTFVNTQHRREMRNLGRGWLEKTMLILKRVQNENDVCFVFQVTPWTCAPGTWPSSASNWMWDLAPAPHHLLKFHFHVIPSSELQGSWMTET